MSTPAAAPSAGVLCSVGPYPERQQDTEDRFHGKRLFYIAWENHLMYAAPICVPLPPTLPFGALVRDVLPELYGEHPEFEAIDWQRTQWFNSQTLEGRLVLRKNGADESAEVEPFRPVGNVFAFSSAKARC